MYGVTMSIQLVTSDGGPVAPVVARRALLEAIDEAVRLLPDPQQYGFVFYGGEAGGYDHIGYQFDEEGYWSAQRNHQAPIDEYGEDRQQELPSDGEIRSRWRQFRSALDIVRPAALQVLVRAHSAPIAWGASYDHLQPVTERHDRNCEKHDVCSVVGDYRRAAGHFHARAFTPPRDRPEERARGGNRHTMGFCLGGALALLP
jgi:hypothetical protein